MKQLLLQGAEYLLVLACLLSYLCLRQTVWHDMAWQKLKKRTCLNMLVFPLLRK